MTEFILSFFLPIGLVVFMLVGWGYLLSIHAQMQRQSVQMAALASMVSILTNRVDEALRIHRNQAANDD